MGDLEGRLRAEVTRRAQEFAPSADLPDRIEARVRQRRRQRRLVAGVVSTAAAAVLALGVILARPSDDDSMRVGNDREAPTTTTPSTTPSTASNPATTESPSATPEPPASSETGSPPETTQPTTQPPPGAGPSIGPDTPLSRSGIGPIRAGMTLHEAEAAGGVTITPPQTVDSTCATAQVEGVDLWFMVSPAGQPGEDPIDGVIRSVQGGRRTVEGVALGDPIADLAGIYGSPTRTLDYPYLPDGQVFVYESGGYAYSVTTDGATVVELESGDPNWVANLEGCA